MRTVSPLFPAGPAASRPTLRALTVMLGVSGAVALIYEVVWQRQFSLVFGSSAPAAAAVLAAYFAGLGTGSLCVGRWAARWQRPLRAYALLELAVGGGALLVAPLLGWFEGFYPVLYQMLADQPGAFVAVRVGLAFAVLLIPTFGMGGTLPLLGRLVDQERHQLGQTAGWLYVVNTAGAALGALAVPFVLLPRLGLTHSLWLGAALNFALALVAWWLDRRRGEGASAGATRPPVRTSSRGRSDRRDRNPVGLETSGHPELLPAFLSGVATFALQVLWNRAFAQVHENSLYSFAVIVAVVITALALGGQLARWRLHRGVRPTRLLGGAWLLGGLAVLAGPFLFLALSHNLGYLVGPGGWSAQALRLTGMATAVLLVPMTLLGVGLPALMELAGKRTGEDSGQSLGRLLAANVLGSVTGALAAGFLLPVWLGLWSGILWLGLLLGLAGWYQWQARPGARVRRWPGFLLTAGWVASLWAVLRVELPCVRLEPGEQLLALAEGTHGLTAVVERPGSRRLKLNNHYGLGGTASTGDERLQAHLPLLLHPAPKRVAFLGLGTGITAGGAMFHPVEELTVMELVPEVVAAARRHFLEANAGVLTAPRTRVVPDDARNFLRGAGARFDVIIGDLVVPWRQGEGALFTREQFLAARGALAPGGVFCQWLPLFQLSEAEVAILVRTFLSVFPQAQVWRGDFSPTEPALALIGSAGDWTPDPATVRRRLAGMEPDPANPQLPLPGVIWMNLLGRLDARTFPAGDGRINTEDRPWVELLGPMLHAGGDQRALLTGRRLQAWLGRLPLEPSAGLALSPAESAAQAAGGVLAEFTLALAEEDRAGVALAQRRLQTLLPAEVYRQLFP